MNAEILLPASKSISNRVLIIRALAESNIKITNLSCAKDTQDLLKSLESEKSEIFVGDGATTLRFFIAYLAVKNKRKLLRGSLALQKRPLKSLLQTLQELGCKFRFPQRQYELPLEIVSGIKPDYPGRIHIESSVSSQFASSILLIAPYLKHGLEMEYSAGMVSEPYMRMTLELMREFGVNSIESNHTISISPSRYQFHEYSIEADWSAACFFYALLGLRESGEIHFPKLRLSGLQGDQILARFFETFGITTIQENDSIVIRKTAVEFPDTVEFDFTNYPDLFPAICIFCALKKTNALFHGLQHLVFKESNRLKVISDFLMQQNVSIHHHQTGSGDLAADFIMNRFDEKIPEVYQSHYDHRIAMAFSLLNTLRKVDIQNPEVVQKSFPNYWKEFEKIVK